ncbi:transcriptional regulator BetI [Streptomyces sp. YIM 130001]|uniref:TetR/AcrR family transcriptional regulator n=1 Tax=Streptomyces sp. YIM 130001 TaxID=2259644 RepID=UPI000E65C4C2|nr:TetR/AcrR family transcriptional regulator [Streptomyces sp. YIM 130001]RII15044.1 transcriptional regulator BetI [Streptomyces sp. YIM 130001]
MPRSDEPPKPADPTDPPPHPTEPTDRPYHHGDLRRSILTAALEAIAAHGPAALSLRDLARRAGVSHAAPAHHFKDRTGLLTAIAAEGYALLAETLSAAGSLREAGVRYVRFAREQPAYFVVMFRPELLRTQDLELSTAQALASHSLRSAVDSVPAEGRGEDARLAGVAAWSLAHGFATLLMNHNLDDAVGEQDPENMFRALAEMLFRPAGS